MSQSQCAPATIIPLPTSSPAPIAQPKRRGRYPSNVVSWQILARRQAEREKLKAEIAEVKKLLAGHLSLAESARRWLAEHGGDIQ